MRQGSYREAINNMRAIARPRRLEMPHASSSHFDNEAPASRRWRQRNLS